MAIFLISMCVWLMGCGAQTVQLSLPDGFTVHARVADTPETTAKGLMFVKHLPQDQGMLFVFDQEDIRYFWMKNTLIDLDIIFLNEQGIIHHIFEKVPHTYTYTPDAEIPVVHAKAKYVLEVPAGTAAQHHLKKGDKLL